MNAIGPIFRGASATVAAVLLLLGTAANADDLQLKCSEAQLDALMARVEASAEAELPRDQVMFVKDIMAFCRKDRIDLLAFLEVLDLLIAVMKAGTLDELEAILADAITSGGLDYTGGRRE